MRRVRPGGICMRERQTRREWLLKGASVAAAGYVAQSSLLRAARAIAAPVAITRCKTYDPAELVPKLKRLFDLLGGLGRIVKGKTVAVKINMTGAPGYRLRYLPLGDTHYTHPNMIAATIHLMERAGARRIRVLESPWSSTGPVEESLLLANIQPRDILNAATNVEFENTNYLGRGKRYSRLMVPFGGLLFPGYDLNHSYEAVSYTHLRAHETRH